MDFNIYVVIAFVIYFIAMLGIGIFSFYRSKNMSDYFLGGRQLGSWVTAISAQASDMSGWLLLGLPGAVLLGGLTESWIAIGLFIGTYLNWKIIASRLRKFTAASGDSITIPEYMQNRFLSKSPIVRIVCAVIIFVFFLLYTASAFSAGAKLFNFVFGIDYVKALFIGAVIIISYTFLGGFLAVCWTDLIQGTLMFCALIIVPAVCFFSTPDFSWEIFSNVLGTNSAGGAYYLDLLHNPDGTFAIKKIISGFAWGLGYFGMPHILVRFMAVKSSDMIKKSRIIACIWVLITLTAAVLVGVFGYAYLNSPGNEAILAAFNAIGDSEKIFMFLSSKLLPSLLAGIILSAILAAIMSTADSQLLVTASAVTNDIFKLIGKNASEKTLMWVSRMTVVIVAIIAFILAIDPNSSVMGLVSYAWAGLGSAFGPTIILSLFWKRMTMSGAVAGMISGGVMVVLWTNLWEASTGIYSLLPAFIVAFVMIIIVSLLSKKPPVGVEEIFIKASETNI